MAVVTIVHGRHEHLRRQRDSLLRQTRRPDHWVVVAMGDRELPRQSLSSPSGAPGSSAGSGLSADIVEMEAERQRLPLARARNLGAARARSLGADVLVFLDVDCLAGPTLVEAYGHAAGATGAEVWSGPVTYLPPPPPGGYDLDSLPDDPHPARPAPSPGTQRAARADEWDLFWSLSFALSADALDRTGGFCEDYVGYGGEDTDFAQRAREAGLGLTWLGSARAHHQHHPVSRPPVEHAVDIVRNATLFHRRWGWWPMRGWLEELASLGVVHQDPVGDWQVTR